MCVCGVFLKQQYKNRRSNTDSPPPSQPHSALLFLAVRNEGSGAHPVVGVNGVEND